MTAPCQWPDKVRHPSKDAAAQAIRELYQRGRGNPDLATYRCGDHWHVGHDVRHFKKRIKAVLRQGARAGTTYARNRRTKK